MIEIEKNFDLAPGDKERLIRGAEFINKKSFTDVYYDNHAYDLTGRDFWLRTRDGRFELKVPLNIPGAERAATDQYRELESDADIAAALGLPIKTTLADAVKNAGYAPFATITTVREYYRKGDFNLDFDEVREFDCRTFEAELMIASEAEIATAEARILDFAKQHGISTPGRGKLIEYLKRNNPRHYRVLKERGIVRD